MSSNMIPYVISVSHPREYEPWVKQSFGVISESEMNEFFLKKMSEAFTINGAIATYMPKLYGPVITLDMFNKRCEMLDDEHPMGNDHYEARVFMNGEWIDVTPKPEDLIKYNIRMMTPKPEVVESKPIQNFTMNKTPKESNSRNSRSATISKVVDMAVEDNVEDISKYPVRKMAPFIVFSNQKRSEVKAANPSVTLGEISKILREMWEKMPKEEQNKYVDTR